MGADTVAESAAVSASLLAERLHNQQLTASTRRKPAQVVSWLGAMQAQDYPAAKWAIGLRAPRCMNADVDQAFNDGAILRTHVLRPTWHFVAPDDIRWVLALSAPRVRAASAYYHRQAGLTPTIFKKSCAIIHRALEGGQFMTRAEIAARFRRYRIPADGLKLAYLVMHAELDGLICSGPRRANQFTYALLDERAPRGRMLDRDASLAELAKRYFTSHGPATIRDFTWWSGLTVKDAQQGIAGAGSALVERTIDGRKHWSAPQKGVAASKRNTAFLLPNYDEYLIAYKDRGAYVDASRTANLAARTGGALANHLVIDGCLAGGWSRTIGPNAVKIDVAPYKKLTPAQSRALATAVEAYGEFLGLPATLALV
jgi:hypothetical protein